MEATSLPDSRDRALIEDLCLRLTGSRLTSSTRLESCFLNITRRMRLFHLTDIREYLVYARENEEEYSHLMSALTIHTTGWFRERPHFDRLKEIALSFAERSKRDAAPLVFRLLSAGCSSGEEAYTMALVLEGVRELFPQFDYAIEGWDIDPLSVERATRAVYDAAALSQVTDEFRRWIRVGRGPTQGLFTLSPEIRRRCQFKTQSLDGPPPALAMDQKFHVIFCRNVLIYFDADKVEVIIRQLMSLLHAQATLCLGHSEGIDAGKFGLQHGGSSTYHSLGAKVPAMAPEVLREAPAQSEKIVERRVLVIDNSMTAKMALLRAFESKSCKATFVASLQEASQALRQNKFELVLVDLDLSTPDQHRWLEEHRRKRTFQSMVVMGGSSPIEAASALGALEHGAQDFIDKRHILSDPHALAKRLLTLLTKVSDPTIKVGVRQSEIGPLVLRVPQIILVGASTGGTEALIRLLRDMPRPCPPVLVVQHIATSFAKSFADRLAQVSGLPLGPVVTGSEVESNRLYMAWDDYHIGVKPRAQSIQLVTSNGPPQHSVRPAVDFLFQSALQIADQSRVMAVLMTGMGKDGARGLLQLKQAGAMTLTQDEASSVVYGMPAEAVALGGSCFSGSPEQMRLQINQALALDRLKTA